MAKRKKVPKKVAKVDRFALIDAALQKKTKSDVIGLLMEAVKDHDEVCRDLESKLNVDKPLDLLLADVAAAIDRATDFDERMMNHNFDVDWQVQEAMDEACVDAHDEHEQCSGLTRMAMEELEFPFSATVIGETAVRL